jgi:hypothetical protein
MPRTSHDIKFLTHAEVHRVLEVAKSRSTRDYAMPLLAPRNIRNTMIYVATANTHVHVVCDVRTAGYIV